MEKDREHKLYLIYPEGNWVEIGPGTPYHIIGASGYGKPVLDRTLKYEDKMRFALQVGCLAFDSTRINAADVDFPVDVVLYPRDTHKIVEHRYVKEDLLHLSNWWQDCHVPLGLLVLLVFPVSQAFSLGFRVLAVQASRLCPLGARLDSPGQRSGLWGARAIPSPNGALPF